MLTRTNKTLLHEEITRSVIRAFYTVHNTLGYGFLEHVYANALNVELKSLGHSVAREFDVTVHYNGVEISHQRLDMVVDERVVVEIKATERLRGNVRRQLYNYLRATNLDVGLLLHFGPGRRFYRVICDEAHKPRSATAPTKSSPAV